LNEIINYPPLEVAILKILALTWCLRQWQNFATEPFNIATKADISDYVAKGAVGIIAGRFIDAAAVLDDMDTRMIGADQAALRNMSGLLVVSGLNKHAARHAALRGGYVTHAVLDMALAEALVKGAPGK
jgi:deoxyribonucleoside regulator